MAFSAFTRAATSAAGLSRLAGLRFTPAQECRRFTVEITSPPSRRLFLIKPARIGRFRCSAILDRYDCQ